MNRRNLFKTAFAVCALGLIRPSQAKKTETLCPPHPNTHQSPPPDIEPYPGPYGDGRSVEELKAEKAGYQLNFEHGVNRNKVIKYKEMKIYEVSFVRGEGSGYIIEPSFTKKI